MFPRSLWGQNDNPHFTHDTSRGSSRLRGLPTVINIDKINTQVLFQSSLCFIVRSYIKGICKLPDFESCSHTLNFVGLLSWFLASFCKGTDRYTQASELPKVRKIIIIRAVILSRWLWAEHPGLLISRGSPTLLTAALVCCCSKKPQSRGRHSTATSDSVRQFQFISWDGAFWNNFFLSHSPIIMRQYLLSLWLQPLAIQTQLPFRKQPASESHTFSS